MTGERARGSRQCGYRTLRIARRAGLEGGQQVGTLDTILRARLFNIERRHPQVAIVLERQLDKLLQSGVIEVVAPVEVDRRNRTRHFGSV